MSEAPDLSEIRDCKTLLFPCLHVLQLVLGEFDFDARVVIIGLYTTGQLQIGVSERYRLLTDSKKTADVEADGFGLTIGGDHDIADLADTPPCVGSVHKVGRCQIGVVVHALDIDDVINQIRSLKIHALALEHHAMSLNHLALECHVAGGGFGRRHIRRLLRVDRHRKCRDDCDCCKQFFHGFDFLDYAVGGTTVSEHSTARSTGH